MDPVLLCDGRPPAALAYARSLVRHGIPVAVTARGGRGRAARSRGVHVEETPCPSTDRAGFARSVEALVSSGSYGTVVAVTDAALLALLPLREALAANARLSFPEDEVARAMLDKQVTLRRAADAGVRTPHSLLALPGSPPLDPPGEGPFVIKPISAKWEAPDGSGMRGAGATYAATRDGVTAHVSDLLARGAPGVLVQEYAPGTGYGVSILMREGDPVAVFVHRRLREADPAGGPSAAAISAAPERGIVEPAVRTLRALRWEGLAMVEFRWDGCGDPVLLEVNGRPWGTLGLAVDSGVDFPVLDLERHRGPPPPYRVGVRRRWFAADLMRLRRVAAGRPAGYPGPFPSLGGALMDVLFGGGTDFVFRWSDPMPFVAEMTGVTS